MTDHVNAAAASLLRRAREDPEAVGRAVVFYADGVANEQWPQAYQDAVGQPYRGRWLTLPQVLQWVAVNDYVVEAGLPQLMGVLVTRVGMNALVSVEMMADWPDVG